jgi:putative aldouronate transport system substrate-binding protein
MFALLVAVGAVVTFFGATAQRGSAKFAPLTIPLDAKDDPANTLTISWLGAANFVGAKEGGWLQRFVEQRFNVKLQPIFMDGNSAMNRRPLMFSAGNIPDLVYEGDPTTVQRYARQGFYTEVPYAVIKKYAPTYVKYLNATAPQAWLYSYWNGKNYGLPTQWLDGRYPACPLWRKDWLDKVGIHKIPDTLDELHTALYRFRYNDPDGDGKMDTYGTTTDLKFWWSAFNEVYSGYGVMPWDWQCDSQGNVVWGGIQPQAKAALAVLQQWYREGLIDPDFVTDVYYGTMRDKFINGKIGYLNDFGSDYTLYDPTSQNDLRKSITALNPAAVIVPGPLPAGPRGRGFRVWSAGGNILCFGPDVARHPEKLVRILTMFEAETKDQHLAITASSGKRGIFWDFNDPKRGWAGGTKLLPPYDDANQANMAVIYGPPGGDCNIGGFFCNSTATPERCAPFTRPEQLAFTRRYLPTALATVDLLGKPDTVPSSGEYIADLRALQISVYAEIIRGKDLRAFDDFAKEWRRRGGDRMTAEARVLQQQKLHIYRELGVPGVK